jgi:hypothetical protein
VAKQKRSAKTAANPRAKRGGKKNATSRVELPPVDGQRWVSLTGLNQETGVPVRTLNEILRTDPGVLVVRSKVNGQLEYEQPTCAIRLRERAVRIAVENIKGNGPNATIERQQAEADLKKAQHAAGIEELKEAEMKRQLVRADEVRTQVSALLSELSAAVDIFPAQHAKDVIGVANEADGLLALQRIAREVRASLRRVKLPEIEGLGVTA